PTTASRDDIEAAITRVMPQEGPQPTDRFPGIRLGTGPVTGIAVRAEGLGDLLLNGSLPPTPVLVVPSLEPSWAVVFPRFAAVVTELGGELSHASILLREAGIPSVINAQGAFLGIADGDRFRVDPEQGEVTIEARAVCPGSPD